MKSWLAAGALAAVLGGAMIAGPAFAHAGHEHAVPQTAEGEGVVTAVDAIAATITLRHGPIAALHWSAMTMTFPVQSANLLTGVAVGARVHFTLINYEGHPMVSELHVFLSPRRPIGRGLAMFTRRHGIAALLAAFVLPFSLSMIAPALAHGDEVQTAARAQSADPSSSDSDPPAINISSAEMTWPTGDEDGGMMMAHRVRPTTFSGRVIAWLGAWHPAVIHFPIALLLTVAFLELAALVRHRPLYSASNKILLAVGVAGAFVAAPLGWADAGPPSAEDGWALTTHRWLGSAIPFLLLMLWQLKKPSEQAAVRPSSRLYELILVVAVMVVLAQAYLGGEMTHGANHMAF